MFRDEKVVSLSFNMSRVTLQWFELNEEAGKDPCLRIPIGDIYGPVIDRAFPSLGHIGWRPGTNGAAYTYIKRITSEINGQLVDFLGLLREILALTITRHLAPHFHSELDELYALDFNFKQDVQPLTYTEVGTLEHRAKENQDSEAIESLAARMSEVIRRHPSFSRADVIVAVPPRPGNSFHLPVELVKRIGETLGRGTGLYLAKTNHSKLRGLALEEKLKTLDGIFQLNESITGKTVLIIDDLYQSGVTAWSLAKFLKTNGAREVYAFACVKSWIDTDNL
jgi:predicted amidophosphoribosyltransferase